MTRPGSRCPSAVEVFVSNLLRGMYAGVPITNAGMVSMRASNGSTTYSEIEEVLPQPVGTGDQADVVGLDVPVDHSLCVRRQRRRRLPEELGDLARRSWAELGQRPSRFVAR